MDPFPPLTRDDRLLILAPHPDDESLATAGLLQRAAAAGTATRIIFLTDGDNNPWPQRLIERRWRVSGATERARWGSLRRGEALAALRLLGHDAAAAGFWVLPDQGLTRRLLVDGDALVDALCREVAAWSPSHWVVPSPGDRHPDHSALGVAVDVALRRLVAGQPGRMPPRVFSYLVHGLACPCGARLLALALTDAEQAAKRRAILCHHSQVMLSRRRFLAHARPGETFLMGSMAGHASASHRVRQVRWDERGLEIEWEARGAGRFLGPLKLQLLAESDAGTLCAAVVATGAMRGRGRLRVPATVLGPDPRFLFIRQERGLGLYANSGWVRHSR